MDECRRMGLDVLGPEVNESFLRFTVNKKGNIRFGLAAVKGVGAGAVEALIAERDEAGTYNSVYDFAERVNLKSVNKKVLESLAMSGALDNLSDFHRSQYVTEDEKGQPFIESLTRYGMRMQEEKGAAQQSLFGGSAEVTVTKPVPPPAPEWSSLKLLNAEKDCVGIYLSAHPLDDYRLEIDHFCNASLSDLGDLNALKGQELKVAGIVTAAEHRTTKNNKPFGKLTIEDFTDQHSLLFFSKDYITFRNYLEPGFTLYLSGKVSPRPFNEDELELKIKDIRLLSEIRESMINSITLRMSISAVNPELIRELELVARKNKGNTDLKFLLFDPIDKIWVQLFSRSHRVDLTPDFMAYLKSKPEIEFKIE